MSLISLYFSVFGIKRRSQTSKLLFVLSTVRDLHSDYTWLKGFLCTWKSSLKLNKGLLLLEIDDFVVRVGLYFFR